MHAVGVDVVNLARYLLFIEFQMLMIPQKEEKTFPAKTMIVSALDNDRYVTVQPVIHCSRRAV